MGLFDSLSDVVSNVIGDGVSAVSDVAPAVAAGSAAAGFPWGAALSAGATLLGSQMTNNTNMSLANQQMAFSAAQASSIYSRGAQDLANAGINPILAYSSPASMASYSQPNIQPSISLAAGAFNSALDAQSRSALNTSTAGSIDMKAPWEAAYTQQIIRNKKTEQGYTSAQTAFTGANIAKVIAETGSVDANTAKTKMETVLTHENVLLTQIKQEAEKANVSYLTGMQAVNAADVLLKHAQATNALSSSDLNRYQSELAKQKAVLNQPDLHNVMNHEDAANFGAWLRSLNPLTGLFKTR